VEEGLLRLAVHLKGVAPLPLTYREGLQAALYALLPRELRGKVHNEGFPVGGKSLKYFVFSRILGLRLERKTFYPDSSLRFFLASPLPGLIATWARALQERGELLLYGKAFPVLLVEPLPLPPLGHRLVVQTLSPVTAYRTLENGKTRYFRPDEPEFSALLEANLNRKAVGLGLPPGRLEVKALPGTRDGMETYKGFWVLGWKGRFLLQGDPWLISLALLTGLGPKGSQGFGFVREAGAAD